MSMTRHTLQKDEISHALVKINVAAMAIVWAIFGGLVVFGMTAWLLIQDGPNPGQHLQLLSNYFIGYSVTWRGSLVGLFYGAVCGGVTGWAVGTIYNKIVNLRDR